MGTRYKIGALSLLAICALDVLPAQAQARPPRDLLMGRDVRFVLTGGASPSGELLGVTADSLSVLVRTQGIQTLGFDQIVAMDVARHSFGWKKVWTWTAVGALVSGVGLTVACSSLDEDDRAGEGYRVCGAVSRPGESHPQALAEPYLNVSAHTAPIIRLPDAPLVHASGRTSGAHDGQCHPANVRLGADALNFRMVLPEALKWRRVDFRMAHRTGQRLKWRRTRVVEDEKLPPSVDRPPAPGVRSRTPVAILQ